MRVPFEPTAFSSNGRHHLSYESVVTNHSGHSLPLRHIDLVDASRAASTPISTLEGDGIAAILLPSGYPYEALAGSRPMAPAMTRTTITVEGNWISHAGR